MRAARVANRLSPVLAGAVVLLALACGGVFVDHFNATSYQHFTDLKAFHLMFIEDFTAGQGKTWDEAAYAARRDEGELLFRQAIEYARGRGGDTLRVHAFNILYGRFTAHCEYLEKGAKQGEPFFSEVLARKLVPVLTQDYDYAIRGEFARMKDKE
jgi:hypothetical protein